MISVPAMLGAGLFVKFLLETPGSAVLAIISRLLSDVAPPFPAGWASMGLMGRIPLLLGVGFLLMVSRLRLSGMIASNRAMD